MARAARRERAPFLETEADVEAFWRDRPVSINETDLLPEGFDPAVTLRMIARHYDVGTILDFGCGPGRLSGSFEPDSYLGVDINPVAVTEAERRHSGLSFQTIDQGYQPQTRDLFLAYSVFQHLPDAVLAKVAAAHAAPCPTIVIAEILGREWRRSQSDLPAFNRERDEYVALFPEHRLVFDLRIPHRRIMEDPACSHRRNRDVSFLVFRKDGFA